MVNVKKCILDIGCNDFTDTLMYLSQGYYVFCVDANPKFIQNVKNFIPDNFNNMYQAINCGISNRNTKQTFYVNNFDVWSSFDKNTGSMICHWNNSLGGLKEEIEIDCIDIPTLYTTYISNQFSDIEYIKIDIEGQDYNAICSIENLCIKPKFLSCEIGGKKFVEKISTYGYTKFQIVNQSQYKNLSLPITTIDNETINHTMIHGCSGPFGIDLPKDNWKNIEKIYLELDNLTQDGDSWYDIHCALN